MRRLTLTALALVIDTALALAVVGLVLSLMAMCS